MEFVYNLLPTQSVEMDKLQDNGNGESETRQILDVLNVNFNQLYKKIEENHISIHKDLEESHLKLRQDMDKKFIAMDLKINDRFDKSDAWMKARFQKVDDQFDKIETRFIQVDEQFDKINVKFQKVDDHFDKVDVRFQEVNQQLDSIHNKLDKQHVGIEYLRQDTDAIYQRFDEFKEIVEEHSKANDVKLDQLNQNIYTQSMQLKQNKDFWEELYVSTNDQFKEIKQQSFENNKGIQQQFLQVQHGLNNLEEIFDEKLQQFKTELIEPVHAVEQKINLLETKQNALLESVNNSKLELLKQSDQNLSVVMKDIEGVKVYSAKINGEMSVLVKQNLSEFKCELDNNICEFKHEIKNKLDQVGNEFKLEMKELQEDIEGRFIQSTCAMEQQLTMLKEDMTMVINKNTTTSEKSCDEINVKLNKVNENIQDLKLSYGLFEQGMHKYKMEINEAFRQLKLEVVGSKNTIVQQINNNYLKNKVEIEDVKTKNHLLGLAIDQTNKAMRTQQEVDQKLEQKQSKLQEQLNLKLSKEDKSIIDLQEGVKLNSDGIKKMKDLMKEELQDRKIEVDGHEEKLTTITTRLNDIDEIFTNKVKDLEETINAKMKSNCNIDEQRNKDGFQDLMNKLEECQNIKMMDLDNKMQHNSEQNMKLWSTIVDDKKMLRDELDDYDRQLKKIDVQVHTLNESVNVDIQCLRVSVDEIYNSVEYASIQMEQDKLTTKIEQKLKRKEMEQRIMQEIKKRQRELKLDVMESHENLQQELETIDKTCVHNLNCVRLDLNYLQATIDDYLMPKMNDKVKPIVGNPGIFKQELNSDDDSDEGEIVNYRISEEYLNVEPFERYFHGDFRDSDLMPTLFLKGLQQYFKYVQGEKKNPLTWQEYREIIRKTMKSTAGLWFYTQSRTCNSIEEFEVIFCLEFWNHKWREMWKKKLDKMEYNMEEGISMQQFAGEIFEQYENLQTFEGEMSIVNKIMSKYDNEVYQQLKKENINTIGELTQVLKSLKQ